MPALTEGFVKNVGLERTLNGLDRLWLKQEECVCFPSRWEFHFCSSWGLPSPSVAKTVVWRCVGTFRKDSNVDLQHIFLNVRIVIERTVVQTCLWERVGVRYVATFGLNSRLWFLFYLQSHCYKYCLTLPLLSVKQPFEPVGHLTNFKRCQTNVSSAWYSWNSLVYFMTPLCSHEEIQQKKMQSPAALIPERLLCILCGVSAVYLDFSGMPIEMIVI